MSDSKSAKHKKFTYKLKNDTYKFYLTTPTYDSYSTWMPWIKDKAIPFFETYPMQTGFRIDKADLEKTIEVLKEHEYEHSEI